MAWGTELAGLGIAFVVAMVTTPAGVSGAVLLVPVQVSILGAANPALTPTNLLYNVIAVPGALAGYRTRRDVRLVRLLAAGTAPGIVVGAVLRVTVLAGAEVFFVVIACVLLPIGVALALDSPLRLGPPTDRRILTLAAAIGIVGGIYGIGGGSILAPILVAMGLSVVAVAPAALAATFIASAIGVLAFAALSLVGNGQIAPDWPLGVAMGLGGLGGGYCGARVQPRVPERLIRAALGLLSVLLAVRYAILGVGV
jgi:uncharacterized membrane protein YfcA